jgi:hypothetical protein
MDTALDPLGDAIARRCGVTVTSRVQRRTTLLLVRYRYHIVTGRSGAERALLAEDSQVAAFAGSPASPEWLADEEAEELLLARPEGNVAPDRAVHFLRRVISDGATLEGHLGRMAEERGQELLEAHRRVREALREKGVSHRVEPKLPPDILGVYVYLPKV